LFGKPTLNARKNKWLDFLSEYDFNIKHIKGKENKVVDALNRRVHEMHATMIQMDLSGHPPFSPNHHFEPVVLINHDIHLFYGEWNVMSSSFVNYRHHVMIS
jgi:hypothetical protein